MSSSSRLRLVSGEQLVKYRWTVNSLVIRPDPPRGFSEKWDEVGLAIRVGEV